VLKLRLKDLQGRKLILFEPKSGKESEIVFIPQKVADRLNLYASGKCTRPDERIFPITYEAARAMVRKAGKWWAFISGPMTCDGIRQLMQAARVCPLRLSARSFSVTRICQRLSGIWARSTMWKQSDGLKTYTGKKNGVDLPRFHSVIFLSR
jgi:hypothetical protein